MSTGEGPIGIGGIGGSGTRVVAAAVASLGYQLGQDLNGAMDDLSFTLLFKRPYHFGYENGLVRAECKNATAAARTFYDARTHFGIRPRHARVLSRAVLDAGLHSTGVEIALPGDHLSRRTRIAWAARRGAQVLKSLREPESSTPSWGWKEPNTFVFLPALYRALPGFRYIHVIRNGLDMVFSRNDFQVRNFGRLYGVEDLLLSDPPLARLYYWSRANTTVADFLAGRTGTHVVRYEDVIDEPQRTLAELCSALDLSVSADPDALVSLIGSSASVGRYREQDYLQLIERAGEEATAALKRFGYWNDHLAAARK